MVYGLNSESQLSIWNEEGFEVKTIDGAYKTTNGWRLFIVVDAEGRIAYMAQNMVNGYGGAMSDTYIRHSDYANHESNPAFLMLGGCNGNLKAISKLCEGKTLVEIEETLKGNTCGPRPTSCADQLARAIREVLEA